MSVPGGSQVKTRHVSLAARLADARSTHLRQVEHGEHYSDCRVASSCTGEAPGDCSVVGRQAHAISSIFLAGPPLLANGSDVSLRQASWTSTHR
jgi:hypothetical protein